MQHNLCIKLSRYQEDIKIKWPNDIYLDNQKIAGILTESIIEANNVLAVIIGFGINLNQKEFILDLKDSATLYLHTNQIYDKKRNLKSNSSST